MLLRTSQPLAHSCRAWGCPQYPNTPMDWGTAEVPLEKYFKDNQYSSPFLTVIRAKDYLARVRSL